MIITILSPCQFLVKPGAGRHIDLASQDRLNAGFLRGTVKVNHPVQKSARKYEACFGKGNYFLEMQDHGMPEQKLVNTELLKMSRELDIPLVVITWVFSTASQA